MSLPIRGPALCGSRSGGLQGSWGWFLEKAFQGVHCPALGPLPGSSSPGSALGAPYPLSAPHPFLLRSARIASLQHAAPITQPKHTGLLIPELEGNSETI